MYSILQVFMFEGIISEGFQFCRYSVLQVFASAGIQVRRDSVLQVFDSAGIRFCRYEYQKVLRFEGIISWVILPKV